VRLARQLHEVVSPYFFAGGSLVGRKSELAVWAGVIKGLDQCEQSDAPLFALGEFLGRLRTRGWHPADVRVVEQCVLELMGWREEQKIAEGDATPAYPPASALSSSMPTAVWT
jgi:hypothetical protein